MPSGMSAVFSSDHRAPGFSLAFPSGGATDGVLMVVAAALRAPAFSLSVGRGDGIELFMHVTPATAIKRSSRSSIGSLCSDFVTAVHLRLLCRPAPTETSTFDS